VILIALHQAVPAGETGAALLLYRAIYFILPLMLSSAFLAGFEVRRIANGGVVGLGQRRFAAAAARLGPAFLAVLTFAAGLMLVVSGANPIHPHRLAILWFHLPRPLVATSHFFGSVAGVLLLFIARGLFFRVDGAWLLAMVLTGAGFALSLARGYAFPETTVLAALWLMLAVTRRQFPRRASLIGQSFSLSWFLSAGCFAVGLLWMVRFAVHDTPFSHQPWWRVEVDADAPLSLRATLGISVLAIAFGLGQLLRLTKGSVPPPGAADLARARAIVARHDRADAALVAMGDKSILFSASGDAFLMFAKRGRSWIALLDPVGPRREWPELIWRFVELAAAHAGRAAFYQIRAESLPHYIETGLRIIKIGEEARVDLRSFSLQGSRRSHLRYALKRGHRDGLAFTLVPPEAVWSVMPIVEALSAEWLAGRGRREKGFSVAAFRPDFIAGQMVALVTQDGAPVAFASVMTTASRREAVLGLMRHADGVSPYAMEFLFTTLILALKEADFQDFSLGLAPLSGLSDLPFAATWYHLGNLIWKHGNMLYNFQGLRLFKSKFDPVWEPRYLAVSGVLGPLFTLTDVAALTSAAPR
jgi:phosphatidylglycerol lysyltransferase